MARLLYVSRTQLLAVSASMRGPAADGSTWKAVRPDGSAGAVPPWFSLTPRSPYVRCTCSMVEGNSLVQYGHQLAQK